MRIREIHRETWVNRDREDVFQFFSDPENLLRVTPPHIPVWILNEQPVEMKEGAVIDLRMRLFGFLPVSWRTKIVDWSPPEGFTDVQPKGPYRYWRHVHSFEEQDGGTLITDHVEYAVPGFFLEPIIHWLAVGRNLKVLFDYRQEHYPKLLEAHDIMGK